jgi:hypothetical protein
VTSLCSFLKHKHIKNIEAIHFKVSKNFILTARFCHWLFNGSARFKNVNNCFNTNIYSYLETFGSQSSNPYLNVVHFLNTRAD